MFEIVNLKDCQINQYVFLTDVESVENQLSFNLISTLAQSEISMMVYRKFFHKLLTLHLSKCFNQNAYLFGLKEFISA